MYTQRTQTVALRVSSQVSSVEARGTGSEVVSRLGLHAPRRGRGRRGARRVGVGTRHGPMPTSRSIRRRASYNTQWLH